MNQLIDILSTIFHHLALVDYYKLFFSNPLTGSLTILAILIPYFWSAFRLMKRYENKPWSIGKVLATIYCLFFAVSADALLGNILVCSFLFRDFYIVPLTKYEGKFKLYNLTITKRLAWYKRSYDKGELYFHDYRDVIAKALIKIIKMIDKKHFD